MLIKFTQKKKSFKNMQINKLQHLDTSTQYKNSQAVTCWHFFDNKKRI